MNLLNKISIIVITGALIACGGSDKNSSTTQPDLIPSSSSTPHNASAISSTLTLSSASSHASAISASSIASVSSSASSQASFDQAGIFDVDYGGFTGVYAFLENNDFYGLHFVSDGSILAGHPHGPLTITNAISGKEHVNWANFIDAADGHGFREKNGMFGRTFDASGVSVSITGLGAAPGLVFNATAKKQKTYANNDSRSLYKDPLPLTAIAGTYTGIMRTVGTNLPLQTVTDLSINNDGNLMVTTMNCTFTGKLLQHENTGVFTITTTVTGSSCRLAGQLKGIVMPLAFTGSSLKLAIQLDDLNNFQSAVFIVKK